MMDPIAVCLLVTWFGGSLIGGVVTHLLNRRLARQMAQLCSEHVAALEGRIRFLERQAVELVRHYGRPPAEGGQPPSGF